MITPKDSTSWLDKLEVNDQVIQVDNARKSILKKVVRLTAKQVIVNDGESKETEQAFWKHNGEIVGSKNSWNRSILKKADADHIQEIENRIEMRELRQWIESKKFNLSQLRAMKRAFDQCK